jgi:hypothetical protein
MSPQPPADGDGTFGAYRGQPLWFRAEDHTYWYGKTSPTRLLSVTEVLQAAGLVNTQHFSEAAAERGTFVHLTTELFDHGTLQESELDEKLLPYLEAYKKFSTACHPKWTKIEHRVGDPTLGIAGTIDRVGSLKPAGKARCKVVLDIKSGAPAPSHAIQLAAYAHFATTELLLAGAAQAPSPSKPLVQRYALYLNKRGSYSLIQFKEVSDIAVFMGARAVCLWRKTHGFIK